MTTTTQLWTNNAAGWLASPITAGATSITLGAGQGARFPDPASATGGYFDLTLFQRSGITESNHEIVRVTARSGDVLTVTRAHEGTTARAFSAMDPVELRVTAGVMGRFRDTTVPSETPVDLTGTFSAGATTVAVTGGYDIGRLSLFLNGGRLTENVDFTATDGANVVLASGLAVDDVLIAVKRGAVASSDMASLSGALGSTLVGNGSETVADSFNSLQLADYTALRAYAGPRKSVYVIASGIAGMFVRDDADTTSADNGGTAIVASNGKRWKRRYAGEVNVQWFGAKGNGVADDTAAIESASNSLQDGQTLLYPGGTYLVSYIWAPHTDSSPNAIGRAKAVCYIHNRKNITLKGENATIKCVNHPIDVYGGFLFCMVEGSPHFTIDGFTFDMSFTGYNNSAAYYPMCGGLLSFDVEDQPGSNQSNICTNLTATNLVFSLFHPLGAYAVTSHPYSGDVNNGYKMISLFCAGDTTTTTPVRQHRNLTVTHIAFTETHNGYGCWAYAYHNAVFKNIAAEAWSTAQYVVDSATMYGVSYLGVVRYFTHKTRGLLCDNIYVKSRTWALRTGSYMGLCVGIAVDSVDNDVYQNSVDITNCTFILDGAGTTRPSDSDVGITGRVGGAVRISGNSFSAWTSTGAWVKCIEALSYNNASMRANYTIQNNIVGRNLVGPFVYLDTRNATGDANRGVRGLSIVGNIVEGWGGEGAVWTDTSDVYYGAESIVISDNVFNGVLTSVTSLAIVLNVKGRTASDSTIIKNNVIKNGAQAIYTGFATALTWQNVLSNGAGDSITEATGAFTPNQGTGLTVVGAFSSSAKYSKIGNIVHVSGMCSGATSIAAAAAGAICTNLPFTNAGVNQGNGSATNGNLSASSNVFSQGTTLYASSAISTTTAIYWSVTYLANAP